MDRVLGLREIFPMHRLLWTTNVSVCSLVSLHAAAAEQVGADYRFPLLSGSSERFFDSGSRLDRYEKQVNAPDSGGSNRPDRGTRDFVEPDCEQVG